MTYHLPRTKRPLGFSLEYANWAPGESPREVVEHFNDRESAQHRVRELSLRNYEIWHSDGYMAVQTDAAGI